MVCAFIQDGLGPVFVFLHFLLELVYLLPLPYVFYLRFGPQLLLTVELIPQLQTFTLCFPHFFGQLVVVDLVFDQFLLILLNLLLGLFEFGAEEIGVLDQAGVLVSLCVKFTRKLDDAFLFEAFLLHTVS